MARTAAEGGAGGGWERSRGSAAMDRRWLIGGVWLCIRHKEVPTAYVIVE